MKRLSLILMPKDKLYQGMKGAIENHISVTRDPVQVTPFQDWPHGSSPVELHWVS